ncbi:hypothetical protein GO491_03140 [Flavobacteriaceae bacterium Ap0902]|nr:hypothetical protein [Flavobacteriaceae bacterium Ap0902]
MLDIFKNNPKLDVVYKTSDERYFYLENDAQNWATSLEDKKVEKLIREADNESADNNDLTEKIKELKELELVKSNYNQMKSLVKYFDLKVADQKAETLIEVLEDYKQKISE